MTRTPCRNAALSAAMMAAIMVPGESPARAGPNPARHKPAARAADALRALVGANAAARVEPATTGWANAIQRYAFADGALYQVYATPGKVCDIMLEPGETLVGAGPVAAGDTARWVIADTVSGSVLTRAASISCSSRRSWTSLTNIVLNTDRRTYHLDLRATPTAYMAAISWSYPQDALIALHAATVEAERRRPVASGIDPAALDFAYRIDGDHVRWRPQRVFDDGHQVFIAFAASIGSGDLPPLFVIGEDGKASLVNYRVRGRYMIVDRLFDRAELRFVNGKSTKKVGIERTRAGRSS